MAVTAEAAMNSIAEIVRETFEQPNAAISRETTAFDIPGWDSLSHTVLMLRVEERFGIVLPEDIEFRDVGDLADTIAKKLAP